MAIQLMVFGGYSIGCFHLEFSFESIKKIGNASKDVLPKKINLEDVHNFSKGWQFVKNKHSNNDELVRNVIIPMVVFDSIHSICHTNAFIGIHQNFKHGMERRLFLESQMDKTIWAFYGKAKRKNALSSEICNAIVKFWTNNMRMSPNMKDVVKRCLA